ncbi:MAG TPA: PHB depolymerase family esterase [Rhizomicrobium sp.]
MWRKLVASMRFQDYSPVGKTNPLKRRPSPAVTPLVETPFAPNPGNLRMFRHLPRGLKAGAPLVVILHGCGQTAAGYDAGAGWSELADRLGFAVLAAEQKAVNNPNTCFGWFLPDDTARGQGEAASIAAMIQTMLAQHKLDARRVFITGLSAGGAMAAAMLAGYPELFAGGAIIAGLPHGAAGNVREALESMRSAPLKTPRAWGDKVRAASDFTGPWPRISLWHGGMDMTVNVNNAQAGVAQWADVHGLALGDARQQTVDGAVRLRWGDKLEVYTVPGLGHGTPIDARDVGAPGPFILQAGISSSSRIADFWGLAAKPAPKAKPAPVSIVPPPPEIETVLAESVAAPEEPPPKQARIQDIILRALKAAGLVKKG